MRAGLHFVTAAGFWCYQVDEIRRRAESCDPKAGEAKGLQMWLASGGKGREGLTDTDILRFIMFRFGRADGVLRT